MKQSINKFIVGFLFVVAIALIPSSYSEAKLLQVDPEDGGGSGGSPSAPCVGADCWGATVTNFKQVQIENTRTGRMVFILNLNKDVYAPGEPIVVLAGVEYPTCGNSTINVIYEGQISGQPNHYTILNQNIDGGYAIYGSRAFTPPFQAPSVAGHYSMNVKAYYKHGDYFYAPGFLQASKTPIVYMEHEMPFTIVSPCGNLKDYTKCADEDKTCSFTGTKNVAYGVAGSGCVFKDATDGLMCNTTTFGFDPIPNVVKSCFTKNDIKEEQLSCDTPCSGAYTTSSNALPASLTKPASFSYPYCGETATVTMNKTGYLPGEQIRISSSTNKSYSKGCSNVTVKAISISSPAPSHLSMAVSGGTMTFTAPSAIGTYDILFDVLLEDEFGNISHDYSKRMNYAVVGPGSSSNSCSVFSSKNECGAQSGCSWNNSCIVPEEKLKVTVFVNNSKTPPPVEKNAKVEVTWKTENAISCQCTYVNEKGETVRCGGKDYEDGKKFVGGEVRSDPFPISVAQKTTFNVVCTDGLGNSTGPDPLPNSCEPYFATCFIADTIVTLADGTTKNIQDVKVGDVLKGEKTMNTVLGLHRPELNGKLYSFNGGRYFVTEEHPFKTTDGWKSINPEKTRQENIGIEVTPLYIGDTLVTDNGLMKINTIDSKEGDSGTDLFNFILSGDRTYYADGYLVHNKNDCLDGQVPDPRGHCDPCGSLSCQAGYTSSCYDGGTLCSPTSTCSSISSVQVYSGDKTPTNGFSCAQTVMIYVNNPSKNIVTGTRVFKDKAGKIPFPNMILVTKDGTVFRVIDGIADFENNTLKSC